MARELVREETGSALVIALVILSTFAVWITAVLSAADSGVRLTEFSRKQPPLVYGVDGAVEQAIQQARYDGFKGRQGDTSCGTTAAINGQSTYVDCAGTTGSGVLIGGGSSPTLGILTLATGSEVGYQQGGNAIVRIDGGVYSNSSITFGQGNACDGNNTNNCSQLNVCPNNGRTVTDGVINANSFNVSSATANFVAGDVGTVMKGAGIPSGTTIKTYVSSTQVTLSTKPTVTASGVSLTFREFPYVQSACTPPPGTKGKVTALGACDTTRIVAASYPLNCPNGSADPAVGTDPGGASGYSAQYAPSQTSGFVDRAIPPCGSSAYVTFQPGRYTDVTALNALTGGGQACPKLLWFSPGTYYFDFSANATPVWTVANTGTVVVGGTSKWNRILYDAAMNQGTTTITSASAGFTSADVGKYVASGNNLPYGATITSVLNGTTATISRPSAGTANGAMLALSSSASLCDRDTPGDHPGVEFIFGGTSRLAMQDGTMEVCAPVVGTHQQIAIYGAKTNNGQLAAQSGCITATPYPASGTCAVISTSGPHTRFMVHGTVYLPNSVIDLSLTNISYQVVSRGMLARVVALGLSPSSDFTDPVIYSPDFGSVQTADREMLFTACINAPCNTGGIAKLRALVKFHDYDAAGNLSPGYSAQVESWSVVQ